MNRGIFYPSGPSVPITPFGQVLTAQSIPRAQIDAVYGLQPTHEVFTASGGSVTTADGNFVCQTGTSVGGYGVLRSHRIGRYRPGQSLKCLITAKFDDANAVANSFQFAGAFNAAAGIGVGYNGTSFGLLHQTDGELHTVIMAVDTAATGAETLTLTLNSVAYAPAVTNVSAAQNAHEIELWMKANQTTWNVQARGAAVTFQHAGVGPKTGTYSVTSTGTFEGSFTTYATGVATTDTWVAQADWNRDPLDGSGPSGWTIDPGKLNVYQFLIPYLGAGAVPCYAQNPATGMWALIHVWEFPGSRDTPTLKNPSMFVGWASASLGSTTNITVKGASAKIATIGQAAPLTRPRAKSFADVSVSTTETNVIALRGRITFGGTFNLREVFPTLFSFANEGGKAMQVRVLLNPTIDTSTPATWTLVDEDYSCVEYSTTNFQIADEGTEVAAATVAGGVGRELHFRDIGIGDTLPVHLEPEDILCVVAKVVSGAAADASGSLVWLED